MIQDDTSDQFPYSRVFFARATNKCSATVDGNGHIGLVVGDGDLMSVTLDCLDRRSNDLPDPESQNVHNRMAHGPASTGLVTDFVLVCSCSQSISDITDFDGGTEMQFYFASTCARAH
jgi:hypothetical protein